ncbi:unnamed protein product, partial [marine sediment metagenome]
RGVTVGGIDEEDGLHGGSAYSKPGAMAPRRKSSYFGA